MEQFDASHSLPGGLSVQKPVPEGHAEPLEMLLDSLSRGRAVFALRAESEAAARWLHTSTIERHLRQSLLEPAHTDVWPLLPRVWLLSVSVHGDIEDPDNLLHLHSLRQSLLHRLEAEWSAPEADEVAGPPSAFTLLSFAALRATREREENLAELNLLLEIIVNQQLQAQFQPIVNLYDGHVFGYEALIRGPKGGVLRRPGALFHAAEKARMISWFDLAC